MTGEPIIVRFDEEAMAGFPESIGVYWGDVKKTYYRTGLAYTVSGDDPPMIMFKYQDSGEEMAEMLMMDDIEKGGLESTIDDD